MLEPDGRKDGRTLDSKARILAAATEEFAEKGQAGARIDDIVRASEVNVRMIYHHFGSKEGLYMAVLQGLLDRKGRVLAEVPEGEPLACIRGALIRLHAFLVENPSYTRILAWEFAAICPVLNDSNFNTSDFSVFIARQVEALRAETGGTATDPMWFGITSVAAVMSSVFWQTPIEGMPARTGEEVADSIMRML